MANNNYLNWNKIIISRLRLDLFSLTAALN